MPISLSENATGQAVASIKRYFMEELEQDIGDLKAGLVLEFVLKEIGPSIYNAAISDASVYLRDRLADLEATCFEPEFGFWPASAPRRRD